MSEVGQTRTSSLGAARPLPPSADIGPRGQSVGQTAQFCIAAPPPVADDVGARRGHRAAANVISNIAISILRRRPPRLSATTGHRSSGALAT